MDDLISRLSEIRSRYNCFDESEEPYYRALSEVIKVLSGQADGDTISRQAVIDAIRKCRFVVDAIEKIRGLPSVQFDHNADVSKMAEPQWIPCGERLPDKTDDYLCSYNGCAMVDICEYDPNRKEWGFFYDGGWKVVSNVLAWMPLPEPWKGERS